MIKQMRPQRSTHLYDALVQSLEKLETVPRRKALLIFSDGEDEGSQTTMEDALEAARRSHVAVYSVGLMGWSTEGGMHTNQGLLRAFFPDEPKQMRKVFDRIRDELHSQYRMGYVPQARSEEPAQWREIQVKLTRRKDLAVRSRLGYYGGRKQAP